MAVPEDELRHRVAHMRQEREHVDFMEKTASLVGKQLARGVPEGQRGSLAASLEALLRANRGLRGAAGTAPEPGELAAEAALDRLLAELRHG
jgi:hypothetical protein